MPKPSARQRKNIRIFLERWKTIPPDNVAWHLYDWQSGKTPDDEPHCDTVACAGGWMALMPEFQELGVYPHYLRGAPSYGDLLPIEVAYHFFGNESVFNPVLSSERGTEHQIVTHRFETLLHRPRTTQSEK